MWPWIRGCASTSSAPDMSEIAAPPSSVPEPPRTLIGRLSDNDLLAGFLASKVTVAAGLRHPRPFSRSAPRAVDRADRPVQSGDQLPHGFARSAELRRRRRSAIPARHGRPGTRHAVGDPLRASRLAWHRLLQRGARRGDRRLAWAHRRIRGRLDGLRDHADRRRAANLSGDSHRASTGRRRPCAAQARKPRRIRLRRARPLDRPFVLGAIRAHRARFDHGGEEPRLRAGGAADRAFAYAHPSVAHPPQRDGAGAGDRDHQSRARDHHRSDALLPRRRPAADPALARDPDPHRAELSVLGRMVDRRFSQPHAGGSGAGGEPARRLACATRSTPD